MSPKVKLAPTLSTDEILTECTNVHFDDHNHFVSEIKHFLCIIYMVELLKVSKSQKQFFLKLHCPKNEQNIRQNSAL